MKTLYSSAFVSVILGFFVLFQSSGQNLEVVQEGDDYRFNNIYQDQDIRQAGDHLTIEVFERFDCGECRRFAKDSVFKLKELYADTDQVSFDLYAVSDPENENEVQSAKTLHCAKNQGRFWDAYMVLHNDDQLIDKVFAEQLATSMELNVDDFNTCFEAEETLLALEEARETSQQREVSIYPTTLINNQRLIHHQPWENVERVLNQF